MLAPPKPPSHDELEALIKEARARQIRRRAAGVGALALAAAVAIVSYSLAGGNRLQNGGRLRPNVSRASSSVTGCTRGRPRLLLSRTSGPPGTVVSVTGCNCPHPYAQADTLAWHNARSLREIGKRPPVSVWRRIPLVRASRTTAKTGFVVRDSDPPGKGLLDMFCGGSRKGPGPGNAIGYFTVTP
jgi:hypothetical protein